MKVTLQGNQPFAATLPRRGKVAAIFFVLRVKFAAKLPQNFAARQSRNKTEISCAAIFPDFYHEILPQLCRDFTANATRSRQFFFSWTTILPRTYRAHFRAIYRDRYREFCRGYIRDFAAIQTQILPRLCPHVYHDTYHLFA
jgi:hypothetical protein